MRIKRIASILVGSALALAGIAGLVSPAQASGSCNQYTLVCGNVLYASVNYGSMSSNSYANYTWNGYWIHTVNLDVDASSGAPQTYCAIQQWKPVNGAWQWVTTDAHGINGAYGEITCQQNNIGSPYDASGYWRELSWQEDWYNNLISDSVLVDQVSFE